MSRPVIIIQRVTTSWTKDARGGENAALRNRVPAAVAIPTRDLRAVDNGPIVHEVAFGAAYKFRRPTKNDVSTLSLPLVLGCVSITGTDSGLGIKFRYNLADGGAPERGWMRKDVKIGLGEWAQVIYNGRFSWAEAGWSYQKVVVNAGVFERPSSKLFIQTEPSVRFSALGRLY